MYSSCLRQGWLLLTNTSTSITPSTPLSLHLLPFHWKSSRQESKRESLYLSLEKRIQQCPFDSRHLNHEMQLSEFTRRHYLCATILAHHRTICKWHNGNIRSLSECKFNYSWFSYVNHWFIFSYITVMPQLSCMMPRGWIKLVTLYRWQI